MSRVTRLRFRPQSERGVPEDPAAPVRKHDSADPSDYERRHRMCLSKVSYLTKNDAICAAKHRQRRCGKDLRRYRCPYCGRIHLTATPLPGASEGGLGTVNTRARGALVLAPGDFSHLGLRWRTWTKIQRYKLSYPSSLPASSGSIESASRSNALASSRMTEGSHACEASSPSVRAACTRNLPSSPGYGSTNEGEHSLKRR